MAKKFGVLTIHGMGSQKPDYDDALRSNLSKMLHAPVRADLHFKSIWYHGDFQEQQGKVWANMIASKNPLDQQKLRKFFLYFLSDAATSEIRPDQEGSTYKRIQHTIQRSIDEMRTEMGDQDLPVVIIAHSLGCQIISNYIWDAQHRIGIWKEQEPTEFQRLGTTRLMITSGCNIPLFVSGLDKIEAFDKPTKSFKWYNFYDRDDILGWPLKPLSMDYPNAYNRIVTEDREIETGWTPLSHSDYWQDNSFIKPVVRLLHEFHAGL